MKHINFKSYLPYLIAVVIFVVLSLAYMSPLLSGKEIVQSDIIKFEGMSKEISDFREATGEEPLWTNSMFGGMPAIQISVIYTKNIAIKIYDFIRMIIPYTADFIFIYLIGFYILLIVLGLSPWLSIVGAIAFAFSSYHFIIITAGHTSKAYAIGYMAPTLAGIILSFRGKYLLGGAVTALFLSIQIAANHLQITYYFLFIIFFWGLGEIYFKVKNAEYKPLLLTFSSLIIAVIIAVGVNFGNIWSTYEYSKQTIRGESELTIDSEHKTSGLDKDYATAWSYGIAESFSFMIPNINGGGNVSIGETKFALDKVENKWKSNIANWDQYWGNQPGTSGPVYMGAIIIFLFILGLLIVKNKIKWFLLAAVLLSVFLGWGKNFMSFTDFFLEYFPMYNKFRAVSMTLVIAEFCVPLLAFITLKEIIDNPQFLKANIKKLYIAFGLTGGLSLLFWLFPTLFFTFFSQMEAEYFSQNIPKNAEYISLMNNLEIARIAIFKADAIRSFIYIALGCGAIVFFLYNIKYKYVVIAALGVLILLDMWTIDKRYLNDSNFKPKKKIQAYFQKDAADIEILNDKDPNYRVFNPDGNPFNDSFTSYHHKSIGGYHGAKLKRYQEIINFYLGGKKTINMEILNMLNTKYIKRRTDDGVIALKNPDALGNAWFVKNFKIVENADAEILELENFKPAEIAIIDKRFEKNLNNFVMDFDSTAQITLTEYKPNKLTYLSKATRSQLAVFSEIYYEPGWFVKVNDVEATHFRVNYILRGLVVPAGENNIVFEFKPKSYFLGEKISFASSILLILVFILAIIANFKSKLQNKA